MTRKRGKSPLGSYELLGVDADGNERWRIRITAGGSTVSENFTGSERDAIIRGAMIYQELTGSPVVIENLTLDEYFEGFYIPFLIANGRTMETIAGYRSSYRKWIRPVHGDLQIRRITDVMVRQCIRESGSPRNVKRTYSAILSAAYFEHKVIPREISLRRMEIKQRKAPEVQPWSASEALLAIEELRGEEIVWPYLMLGLSGLRTEECLGWVPENLRTISSRGSVAYALSVEWTYTDNNGWQRRTKTREERLAPLCVLLADDFLAYLEAARPRIETLDGGASCSSRLVGWGRSQRPRYVTKLVEGTRETARAVAKGLSRPYGARETRPKVERAGDGLWAVRYFDGIDSLPKPRYERTLCEPGAEASTLRRETGIWSRSRLIPASYGQLDNAWRNALSRHGLRRVTPNSLRKTSESIMALAGVPAAVIQKLHGHRTFKVDYENYIRVGAKGVLLANDAVRKGVQQGDLADGEIKVAGFSW